ncbi:MAG: ATP-binding cassette domain-containing protein [Candidatus Limivicinus sp.]|jgi:ABC-type lipoprotein export system ATPase subunit
MQKKNKYAGVLQELFEELLEEQNLEAALAGSLDILAKALKSEAGVIWLLDKEQGRLLPMFHIGAIDLSNFSVELGNTVESFVTKTGEPILMSTDDNDDRWSGTLLDENGIKVKTGVCVPLNNLHEVVGCLQIVNKTDGSDYTEDEVQLCSRLAAMTALTIDEKGLVVNAGEKKEVLISLRSVTKEFPSGDGTIQVLKGIDLDIYKGEFLVILGESGCGKSTLVNIIGGMDNLTSGTLIVDGKDYSNPTDRELTEYRREYMGFVFQSYNLMPNLTAQENVQFIADIAQDPMPAEEAIEKVGLSERAGNYPAALSGGQQQRVSIARAIVKRPKIIFADEPTAALDYQTSIEVLTVFEEIVKSRGTTVVMITHNPEIAKMANRVVKLKGGLVHSVKLNLQPLDATELVW